MNNKAVSMENEDNVLKIIMKLLPVIDDLEKSIGYAASHSEQGVADGLRMVEKKLFAVQYGCSSQLIRRRLMRTDNVEMLYDTLDILNRGYYVVDGRKVFLKLSRQEMEQIRVFLPEDIEKIRKNENEITDGYGLTVGQEAKQMAVSCKNIDSFALARQRLAEDAGQGIKRTGNILVLNLANPVNPGGGVRRGARAQEEDLCRKSSLLLSLESRAARRYYDYNRALETYMGSDAVMITPEVEIIKDTDGNLLKESVVVSVMTCAAPMLRYGLNGMSRQEYEDMLRKRIDGMLVVAACMGYQDMVLGAFGCGAFRNDARIVSDLFYEAIQSFSYNRKNAEDLFRRVDFAVLDFSHDQYNFWEFGRNFNNYYRGAGTGRKGKVISEEERQRDIYLRKKGMLQFINREYTITVNILSEYGKFEKTVQLTVKGGDNEGDVLRKLREQGEISPVTDYSFDNWPKVSSEWGWVPPHHEPSAYVCEICEKSWPRRFVTVLKPVSESRRYVTLYGCPNAASIDYSGLAERLSVEIIDYEN